MRSPHTTHALRAFILAIAALAPYAAPAAPTLTLSAGAQTDDSGASTTDAGLDWGPNDTLSLSIAAGHVKGDSEDSNLSSDFSATTATADMSWQPLERLGFALGYDLWDDSNSYEKRTARGAVYLGGPRLRAGLLAESVTSETTAELTARRQTSLSFDGSGYGLDLRATGERGDLYATYLTYDYDESVGRLATFLSNPNLATRPRLESLVNSRLTAAAALLDNSLVVGGDVFIRQARIGLAFSQYQDIVSDSTTRAVQSDFEWSLSSRWAMRLTAGVSDSEETNSSVFGGVRILFHGM